MTDRPPDPAPAIPAPALVPEGRRKFGSLVWRGKYWSIRWRSGGVERMESTRSTSRRVAEALLARRQEQLEVGTFVPASAKRVRFERLMDLVRGHYRLDGLRSARRVEIAARHLGAEFAGVPAVTITAARLHDYHLRRMDEAAAPSTIRYELAVLRQGFALALELGLIKSAPKMPTVRVDNARQGFFESDELARLLRELPPHMVPVAKFAALTGWRRGEVVGLCWDRVDFAEGVIRLDVRATKNNDGRVYPFAALPELAALLAERRAAADAEQQEYHTIIRHVFTRRGRPLKDFYTSWRSACDRAGLSGKMLHDLRRTAVRNLERAGVPRSVATKLTGHKCEDVYRRYAIVSEADLAEGVAKLAARTGAKGALGGHSLPRAAADSA